MIHTRILWRSNLLTQMSLKAGVTALELTHCRLADVGGAAKVTLPDQWHGLPDKAPRVAVFERLLRYELKGQRPPSLKPPHRARIRGGEGRWQASLHMRQRVKEKVAAVGAAPDTDFVQAD